MAALPLPIFFSFPRSQPRVLASFATKYERIKRGSRVRASYRGLEVLYDDGYGSVGIEDYIDASCDVYESDCRMVRWFCPVDCGPPIKNAPILLFLPGLDGNGMGLFLHHKALGRIFEIRCMHVPVQDRTSFEGLVNFVEDVLIVESSIDGSKPIYILGHSFGGCLAIAVAARNPHIDLILFLSNPATSFEKSMLLPLVPVLKNVSFRICVSFLFLLSLNRGDQVKVALDGMESGEDTLHKLSRSISLQRMLNRLDCIPKETISWKLKILKQASSYANSRLHAVRAEVLVLASCRDSLLPSRDEAKRLEKVLPNCKVRYFDDHGHSLLLETGFHLTHIIKGTTVYRHSRQHDHISDYVPPSMEELETMETCSRWLSVSTSPAMFSTLEDGTIVKGLSGIPDDGPVVLVGNHMLLGLELIPLASIFLREKGAVLRGLGHPVLFETEMLDFAKLFGGVPVSIRNFYRLLLEKSFVLLYPGGAREALHRKGEQYKLIWPHQPEFVRMATRFGATIVPFGAVGEDDLLELVLDYDDLTSTPIIKESITYQNQDRSDAIRGESRKQDLFFPCVLPKIPGRLYYLFGKPIKTARRVDVLNEREKANALYLDVKSEVESCISYLMRKREEDVFRGIFQRALYQSMFGSAKEIPSFEP